MLLSTRTRPSSHLGRLQRLSAGRIAVNVAKDGKLIRSQGSQSFALLLLSVGGGANGTKLGGVTIAWIPTFDSHVLVR